MLGVFITIEGVEGSGKSTQLFRLSERLRQIGLPLLVSKEPGGTALGRELRRLLLERHPSGEAWCPDAELLLFYADRAQHIEQVVRPALTAGHHVVSDRSVYSTLAYQGYGRMLPIHEVREINQWAVHTWWPELVILIDVDPTVLAARLAERTLDRFEQESAEFHARVRAGFHAMAAADPQHWVVVDGANDPDTVAADIAAAVAAHLGLDVR